jgi:RNA polymerase sigma factor (sigma-70 family)
MVLNIARRYSTGRIDLMDLVQEGTLGLLRAAEKYQVSSGNRFSTYAYPWIESKVRSARVNVNGLINLSPEVSRELTKVTAMLEELKQKGMDRSVATLSQKLDLKKERIELLLRINRYHLSLDQTFTDDSIANLHNVIADKAPCAYTQTANQASRLELIHILDSLLTDREAYILKERFGCIDSNPKTIQVVADIMGISRERVRQIEVKSLNILREYFSTNANTADLI